MDKQPIKPTFIIPMDNFTASLENGSWKYDPVQKSESTVAAKPLYKDPVQFKIIEEYEGISKSRYQVQLGKMTLEVVKYLNTL